MICRCEPAPVPSARRRELAAHRSTEAQLRVHGASPGGSASSAGLRVKETMNGKGVTERIRNFFQKRGKVCDQPVQRRSRATYSFRLYMSEIMMASSTNSFESIWWPMPGNRIPSVMPFRSSSLCCAFFGCK